MELASITAGENATDIDKVSCFDDAVAGYSPLLYSLPPHAGFEDFMTCAEQVFESQSRDERLPDKLVCHSLPFFFFFYRVNLCVIVCNDGRFPRENLPDC